MKDFIVPQSVVEYAIVKYGLDYMNKTGLTKQRLTDFISNVMSEKLTRFERMDLVICSDDVNVVDSLLTKTFGKPSQDNSLVCDVEKEAGRTIIDNSQYSLRKTKEGFDIVTKSDVVNALIGSIDIRLVKSETTKSYSANGIEVEMEEISSYMDNTPGYIFKMVGEDVRKFDKLALLKYKRIDGMLVLVESESCLNGKKVEVLFNDYTEDKRIEDLMPNMAIDAEGFLTRLNFEALNQKDAKQINDALDQLKGLERPVYDEMVEMLPDCLKNICNVPDCEMEQ